MLKELEGYDWKEAFGYAGESGTCASGGSRVDSVPGATCSNTPFTREDVVKILAISEGENDGPDWICAGRLKDGRWFFLAAGCDYTGWDCQAGGNATVANTKKDLIRLGIGVEHRARLGLKIAGE